MDPIEKIPNDRKPPRPMRLALLLGMTGLLFLLILNHYSQLAHSLLSSQGSN